MKRNHYAQLGRTGGKQRARNMTPQARSESARKAAIAKWSRLRTPEQRRSATAKAVRVRLARSWALAGTKLGLEMRGIAASLIPLLSEFQKP